jgi:hypothetical protein
MEQAIKGQIGQPAACMIESNVESPRGWATARIMAQQPLLDGDVFAVSRRLQASRTFSTEVVDNFVRNWHMAWRKAAPNRHCDSSMNF